MQKHKPLLAGPGGAPISSGRQQVHGVRASSKDVGLQDSMLKRLQQLEKVNQSLKLEIKEKNDLVHTLKEQNGLLMQAAGEDNYQKMVKLTAERDNY